MEPTRRVWIVLAVAGAGALSAALFANPLLLGIPVGVGAWTLAHQLAFVRSVKRFAGADPPVLHQSLADGAVHAGDSTTLRVRFTDEDGTTGGLEGVFEVMLPPALVTDTSRTRRLPEAGTTEFEVPVRAPTAGSFEIRAPSVRLSSSYGLFHETLRVGNECAVVVEPPVREAEPETARSTHVFVDRRESMWDGRPGRTKLDYARGIGLAITARAADNEDLLRVSFVDDGRAGDDASISPEPTQYERVRQRLYDLVPDDGGGEQSGDSTVGGRTPRENKSDSLRVRRDAARRAERLDGDDTFARTLAPYFETMSTYSERVRNEPLFSSVNASLQESDVDSRFVIVTDDSNREEVRSIARLAPIHGAELSMFVLPSAFFADRDLAALEGVGESSQEYRSFVRELNEIEGVTASEAGPRGRATAGDLRPVRGSPT